MINALPIDSIFYRMAYRLNVPIQQMASAPRDGVVVFTELGFVKYLYSYRPVHVNSDGWYQCDCYGGLVATEDPIALTNVHPINWIKL